MYVTGLGDSGQLGLGVKKAIAQDPTLIPFQYDDYAIVQVMAGVAHSSKLSRSFSRAENNISFVLLVLVSNCGKVFTFGLGSAGQLGHGGTKDILKV